MVDLSTSLRLWYKKPANKWHEALPIGNGSLGAMVFGKVKNERIQLNEDTLWAGYPRDLNNHTASAHLDRVRQLILDGKYKEAQDLIERNMIGSYMDPYICAGNLYIEDLNPEKVYNYKRELDLEDATAITSYIKKNSGLKIERKCFISYPDKLMVLKIDCTGKQGKKDEEDGEKIDSFYEFRLDSEIEHNFRISNIYDNKAIILEGQAPAFVKVYHKQKDEKIIADNKNGLKFSIAFTIASTDGDVEIKNNRFSIKNACHITLLLTAATNFKDFRTPPEKSPINPSEICLKRLEKGVQMEYNALFKRHLEDYKPLFSRVKLFLGKTRFDKLPTDKRIKRLRDKKAMLKMYVNWAIVHIFKKQLSWQYKNFIESAKNFDDPGLIVLYFQYGRYLLISSSRKGSQPANLQGIWNESLRPPWASNYTININTEMNYWPVETANLTECHEPLLRLIEELPQNGKDTARIHYNAKGWCAHHNTTLWRNTNPTDGAAQWAFWPNGGAWLAFNLWEYYDFNRDLRFLKEKAYPLMKGIIEFYMDWLFEYEGHLITCPATSPENQYIDREGNRVAVSYATTCDMAIIRQSFKNFKRICKELSIDDPLLQKIEEIEPRLFPYKISPEGILQEWPEPYDEPEPGHRHMSHLIGLHPGDHITPDDTPSLAQAARESLLKRVRYGGGSTGWSCAWKINLFARLKDGINAYRSLCTILRTSTYISLLDAHPPFQIDGNFGATAGIIEILIQSVNGIIEFLPALPEQWNSGYLKGVKVRGNCIVDIVWENGELREAILRPNKSGTLRFRLDDENYTIVEKDNSGDIERDLSFSKEGERLYTLNVSSGKIYNITRIPSS